MKTLKRIMVITLLFVFVLSMGACKKSKAKNCNEAAADYVAAMERLSDDYSEATCHDVQSEMRDLYKSCKSFFPSDFNEDDIENLCDPR